MQYQEQSDLTSVAPPRSTRRILVYVLSIGTLGSGFFIAPPNTKASGAPVPPVDTHVWPEQRHAADTDWLFSIPTETSTWLAPIDLAGLKDRAPKTRTTPIDHVAVKQTGDSAYVLGYDVHGEPAIELAISHVEGEPRLAATLPSGAYLFVSLHEGKATIDARDRKAVIAQLAELNEALDVGVETKQAGWVDCGVSAVGAIGACGAARPFGCVGGAVLAACACLPLMVEEFEDYDCPGMG